MNTKNKAWDIINSKFWRLGNPRIRPSTSTINHYLNAIQPGETCCIIGASTFELIHNALEKGLEVFIIDFSKKMCDELYQALPQHKLNILNFDILKTIPDNLLGKFSYVLSDRIINRFTEKDTKLFLQNACRLLCHQGELRTVVKIGLYALDHEIIQYQREQGTNETAYDESNNIMDYSKAQDALKAISPHNGQIPSQTLIDWYTLRGQESRYTEQSLEAILLNNNTFTKEKLTLLSKEHVDDDTLSIFYTLVKNAM